MLSEEKIFVLCPPADALFLYQAEFDSGTFQQQKSGEWNVKENDGDSQVKWIKGNVEPFVDNKDAVPTNQPLLSLTHPIRVHVKAGEMLPFGFIKLHKPARLLESITGMICTSIHRTGVTLTFFSNFKLLILQRPIRLSHDDDTLSHSSNSNDFRI